MISFSYSEVDETRRMAMNLSGLTTGSEGGTRISGDARRLTIREIRFFSGERCRCDEEKKTKCFVFTDLLSENKINRTFRFSCAQNDRNAC